jgi:hypothetical protein
MSAEYNELIGRSELEQANNLQFESSRYNIMRMHAGLGNSDVWDPDRPSGHDLSSGYQTDCVSAC